MILARGLLGLLALALFAWCLGGRRRSIPWRVVLGGIGLQLVFGGWVLGTSWGRSVFEGLAGFYTTLIEKTAPGAQLVFGPLADPGRMAGVFGPDGAFVFAFAGTGLLVIITISALMGVLYHLGVMQLVVWCLARVLSSTMRVSGAEAMAMAANIFAGQTEAPLVVRPYLPRMTGSELNALMTGGFATIAGSVLAVYMGVIGPELAPHLLTASVLSAPAAFVTAKLILPETETPETGSRLVLRVDRTASNLVEAAATGIQDGLKLWLNVIAMLVGFLALVHIADWPLGALGEWLGLEGGLSLGRLFGWAFAPIAWVMGVEGWNDCQLLGSLLGVKVALNEFVAYQQLAELESLFLHERTRVMAAYALCGFANFGSVGIMLGGLTPLVPERRAEISRLALRAMAGGALASWMTAVVAGLFVA